MDYHQPLAEECEMPSLFQEQVRAMSNNFSSGIVRGVEPSASNDLSLSVASPCDRHRAGSSRNIIGKNQRARARTFAIARKITSCTFIARSTAAFQ
jgi:hypothetical protein